VNGGTASGLLGRERELAELDAALQSAVEGRARICLVTGEPGIGKTRLADAVTERAGRTGALVRWGRAWEGGGAPAFWPWVQVLRGLIQDEEPDVLRAHLGGGAQWIAQIVPEVRESLPEVETPESLETEQARFALFDAIATFLRNVGQRRPLTIVLEDLHAADPPSVLALRFAGRGLRDTHVFVLATSQDAAAHARPEVVHILAQLAREARHIALGPLSESEIGRLFELRGARSRDPELVRQVHATSGGNPFFATELVRLLSTEPVRDQLPAGARAGVPVPATVREAVLRRFEPLGPDAVATLTVAAAVGRDFRLVSLERVTSRPRQDLLETLDGAIDAHLVYPVANAPGQFTFAHDLMRRTLYEELPAARRIQVHGQIGEGLEELYAADVEPHVAELAHHFLQAAAGDYAEKAVDYATDAGARAMEVLAYEEAERLFVGALSALDLLPPDPHRHAELLLAVGTAQVRAGDAGSRTTLLAAASAARALERWDLLARAALAFRAWPLAPGLADEEVVALLEEALERVEPGDSVLRARLLARIALQIYYRAGTEARRRELAEEAIAIARRVASKETLGYVLSNAQLATWSPDAVDRLFDLAREVLEIADETRNRELALSTHNRQIDLFLEGDELAAADVEIETLDRLANEVTEPRARAHVALQRSRRASIEGRFDDAAELTAEAEALGERAGDPVVGYVAKAQHFQRAWLTGRLTDYEGEAKRIADAAPGLVAWRTGLALIYAHEGRLAEARREFESLAKDDFARIPHDDAWLLGMALLGETCALVGDEERARVLYRFIEPYAARNVISLHGLFAGPASRYLGLLAFASGDRDTALHHLGEARAVSERMGARPILAMLNLDEAGMLAGGGAEDRSRAASLAAEAAAIAEEIGAGGLAERAAGLRDDLGGAIGEAPPPPARERGEPVTASLRREGDVWVFEYEGRPVRIRDSKGMRYMARLLAMPGVEVHALDLVGGVPLEPGVAGAAAAEAGLEVQAGDLSAGPLLDEQAKAAYRERVEALREEIEEADSFNDPERAARAREEMELIAEQLAGAVGLGGRDRKAASTSERARVNATRSIRSLLKRVAEYDQDLGHELEATVRTGTFCAYEPDPRRPVTWTIEAG
jgi:AAA ATPase-like protein